MTDQETKIYNDVIDSNFIFSLAVSTEDTPYLCTAFYVTNDNKTFYFKSRTESDHSKSLVNGDKAAISIYEPNSTYSEKSGIQGIGTVQRVRNVSEMAEVVALYGKRFAGAEKRFAELPELIADFVSSTMYKFTIEQAKVMNSKEGVHSVEYIEV
jgi:uncharacterized protein YhbP (UPF0306 family)